MVLDMIYIYGIVILNFCIHGNSHLGFSHMIGCVHSSILQDLYDQKSLIVQTSSIYIIGL